MPIESSCCESLMDSCWGDVLQFDSDDVLQFDSDDEMLMGVCGRVPWVQRYLDGGSWGLGQLLRRLHSLDGFTHTLP